MVGTISEIHNLESASIFPENRNENRILHLMEWSLWALHELPSSTELIIILIRPYRFNIEDTVTALPSRMIFQSPFSRICSADSLPALATPKQGDQTECRICQRFAPEKICLSVTPSVSPHRLRLLLLLQKIYVFLKTARWATRTSARISCRPLRLCNACVIDVTKVRRQFRAQSTKFRRETERRSACR